MTLGWIIYSPEIYEADNRLRMEEISRRRVELGNQLEDIEEQWLQKSEALQNLSDQISMQNN